MMCTIGRDVTSFDHRTGAGNWGCVWGTAVEACDMGKRLWSMGGIDDEAKVVVKRLMANMTMTTTGTPENTSSKLKLGMEVKMKYCVFFLYCPFCRISS